MQALPANGPHVVLLAAGDTVYVFAEHDERIDVQALALYAANLDVERFKVPEVSFDGAVRPALSEDGTTIVDTRAGAETPAL